MKKQNHPILVRPLSAKDGGGYLAEAPDLPGCIANGSTVEEAIHDIESAIMSDLTTLWWTVGYGIKSS